MSLHRNHGSLTAAAMLALLAAGCATAPIEAVPLVPGGQATVRGTILAVDVQPWTYDGNAQVRMETDTHGTVSIELPARWNLCKAPPVDVDSLKVGRRALAIGTVGEERQVVVCELPEHRLTPLD